MAAEMRGEWSPVQGELVPPRNSSDALCKGELTAESARNDGRRAGGGCLGRSVAPIYEERGAQGLAAGGACWLAWGAELGHRSSWGWRGQGGTRSRCCRWAWGS